MPSPEDLPDPGIEPGSPALWADTLPSEPPGKSNYKYVLRKKNLFKMAGEQMKTKYVIIE